jgi:DNA-binding Xre family transcriptional regulator
MKNPRRRRKFETKYGSFLLSEVIHGLMKQEKKSVRELAREVGISPTVIQDLRSGERTNVTLRNFLGIVSALGGEVAVRKDDKEMVLSK